jgi:hypothetical protein
MQLRRPQSPTRSCFARTRPNTTGFTNSRWLGLKHIERCTRRPVAVIQSLLCPKWYFTSPRPM